MSSGPPKKPKSSSEKSILATMPWAATNFGNSSEIDAYVEKTGSWETVAETRSIADIADAEDIAAFIVSRINQSQEAYAVLKQALVSLGACLACNHIDPKVKGPAETAIKNIKKIMY